MNWSQFVLFALHVDSPPISQDAEIWWRLGWNHTWFVLSQVTQDNQVVCGIELCVVEEEPAVSCSHERRIVLGIEENWKTVMLSSLTLTASPVYETHRNYQRLHGYSSSFTPSLPAYPSVTFPCLYKVQYHSRSSNGRNIASYQIEVQSSGPWWRLRVRTG